MVEGAVFGGELVVGRVAGKCEAAGGQGFVRSLDLGRLMGVPCYLYFPGSAFLVLTRQIDRAFMV